MNSLGKRTAQHPAAHIQVVTLLFHQVLSYFLPALYFYFHHMFDEMPCSNAGHSKATDVRFARIHRHSSPSQTVTTLKGHLVFLPRQPGASPTVLYDHINPFKGLCPICIAVDEMRGWEPASPEEPDKRGEKAAHSNRLPVLHH